MVDRVLRLPDEVVVGIVVDWVVIGVDVDRVLRLLFVVDSVLVVTVVKGVLEVD